MQRMRNGVGKRGEIAGAKGSGKAAVEMRRRRMGAVVKTQLIVVGGSCINQPAKSNGELRGGRFGSRVTTARLRRLAGHDESGRKSKCLASLIPSFNPLR